MKCPLCDERMREVERYGVTIDICPSCKGVWLDRGELDKLIERSDSPRGFDREQAAPRHERPYDDDAQRYKRRKSFLSELFD